MEGNKDNRVDVIFGIDCDPFQRRPNVYAKRVFEYLGIEYDEPFMKCFGAWQWIVEIDEDAYDAFDSWMSIKMEQLYNSDKIRGAMWKKA